MRTKLVLVAGALWMVAGTACSSSSSNAPASTSPTTQASLPVTAVATSAASTTTGAASSTTSATVAPTTSLQPVTTIAGAVDPNAPEIVEPGDIPDNQVFVTFPSPDAKFSVDVPEGWARTELNGVVTFTDKYNSVTIQSKPVASAPTLDSVKADGLTDVSADPSFTPLDVTTVTRKSGDAVLAKFEIGSAPNSVTGKRALLAVERYVFFRNGTKVILTLSGAKGADNVDPWKTVSDSLTWL